MQRKLLIAFVVVCAIFSGFVIVKYIYEFRNGPQDVKEAFKAMDKQLEGTTETNQHKIDSLKLRISELDDAALNTKVAKLDSISLILHDHIQALKDDFSKTITFNDMDSEDPNTSILFNNDSERGRELVFAINEYRTKILGILDSNYPEVALMVKDDFTTKKLLMIKIASILGWNITSKTFLKWRYLQS